ncbi:MAG: four helix bundle protein [Candidatus Didemnitutus sp.]|nr:four helix bundle protein [Candidatus Didemnitutus sp.]
MSERISSFRELRVYGEACALDLEIFEITKRFPREELYSLTDLVRRSSRSIGATIAEAWAKRRYPAHFVSKLTDADGELQETWHWLHRTKCYAYITEAEFVGMEARSCHVGQMLGKMISSPDDFC